MTDIAETDVNKSKRMVGIYGTVRTNLRATYDLSRVPPPTAGTLNVSEVR